MIKVRNAGSVSLCVNIVNTLTRKVTQVNIQPKGSVVLPKDYTIEPNYLARNKAVLRIVKKD